jgi:hypothetical protein
LRDGKPLIFGWGAHLTRRQKAHYEQLATWSFIGLVIVAVLSVVAYGLINENWIVPNKTIVSVNGTSISQDAYRKELAYLAQDQWNTLQSEIQLKNSLAPAMQSGDAKATIENSIVTSQLQSNELNYAQAQITQTAVTTLEEDTLIEQAAQRFEQQNHAPVTTFEPSQKDINSALAAFKKAFPNGETYAQFISANGLTDGDVIHAITIKLRRDKMQTYLASRLVSPAKQIHIRRIELDTQTHAAKVLAELKKANFSDAEWAKLAKTDSLDPNTKSNGGDLGWAVNGSSDGGIEYWLYSTNHKVGDVSPVIKDTSGTFDVVQVLAIDPSRAIDAATLKAAQDNALSHFLNQQRAIPSAVITSADSTMLNASRNLPKKPSLSAALPAITPTVGSGLGPGLGG